MTKPALAIFIAVFGLYMLTSSREPAWGDAHPMWEVGEALVDGGRIDIKTRWPDDIPLGPDHKIYGIAPIGPGLMHVPGAAVMAVSHRFWRQHDTLVRPLATHVGPSAMGALAAVLFFLLLVDLKIRTRTASACTAIFVLATTTWVYAHYPYSEILQLACFLGFFRATLRTANDPSRREALWWGAWAGMLVDSKYVFALAVIGGAVLVGWTLRARREDLKRVALWAAIAGAPFLALACWYNHARWGAITATGYGPYLDAFFGGSIFDGAWGMLASPNKSAFLYSPPLVLALLGAPAAFRAVPRLALALVLLCVPTFLVYCTYRSWSGDYAWGPRFFVWMVPPLLVPMAWFIDRPASPSGDAASRAPVPLGGQLSRWKRAVAAAVIAAGVCIQLLGISLYWDHYIRIAIDAKNQWLGQPNRSGSYIPTRGRPHCDSCFEDTYELTWTPAFQPIRGQWWLLKSLVADDSALEAQQHAPWRTYTSLDVHVESDYARLRLDWWVMLWWRDAPESKTQGIVILLLLLGCTGVGTAQWLRYHRRAT